MDIITLYICNKIDWLLDVILRHTSIKIPYLQGKELRYILTQNTMCKINHIG